MRAETNCAFNRESAEHNKSESFENNIALVKEDWANMDDLIITQS